MLEIDDLFDPAVTECVADFRDWLVVSFREAGDNHSLLRELPDLRDLALESLVVDQLDHVVDAVVDAVVLRVVVGEVQRAAVVHGLLVGVVGLVHAREVPQVDQPGVGPREHEEVLEQLVPLFRVLGLDARLEQVLDEVALFAVFIFRGIHRG